MHIEHIALWVKDLEKMKLFFTSYFRARSSEKYTNELKQFSSYFLSFDNGGRLELMHRPGLETAPAAQYYGWAHIAISVNSREEVDRLTDRLMNDGYTVESGPRTTGDGYYESVILDPEGNKIEITV